MTIWESQLVARSGRLQRMKEWRTGEIADRWKSFAQQLAWRDRPRFCARAFLRRAAQPHAARFLDRTTPLRAGRPKRPRHSAARPLPNPVDRNRRARRRFRNRRVGTTAGAAVDQRDLAPRAPRKTSALQISRRTAALPVSEPEFLVAKWTQQFGAEAALELCRWNNRPAPIYARINQLKTTAAEFLRRTRELFAAAECTFRNSLEPAAALQGGDCYIQDPSTAIACELLRPAPGETVLDACAAPGGKSAYLAEMMANEGTLVACDQDGTRLERLRQSR